MRTKIVIPDDFPIVISGTDAEQRLINLREVRIYTDKPMTLGEIIERIKTMSQRQMANL
jgi:hypothetical protein